MSETLSRDEARAHWAASGLTYDTLTQDNLKRLRELIDEAMRSSGAIRGTFRAGQRFSLCLNDGTGKRWAHLKCKAYYFDDRQAVTFEAGGFIGFAGWADENNVQPILSGFCAWVDELKAAEEALAERERVAA